MASTSAALAVFTDEPLLSLVTSFQYGLPGITGPLIARYLRPLVDKHPIPSVSALWETPSLIMVETYTSEKATIVQCVVDTDHSRLRYDVWKGELLRCAREAAVAFGRTDTLAWLHRHYGAQLSSLPPITRFATPLSARLASPILALPPKWRACVTVEAVAQFDNESLDTLQYLLRRCDSQSKPAHERRCFARRVWQAAAAFGRVDILKWLLEAHGSTVVSTPTIAHLTADVAARRRGRSDRTHRPTAHGRHH